MPSDHVELEVDKHGHEKILGYVDEMQYELRRPFLLSLVR